MNFVVDNNLCVQCGACVADCPRGTLGMVERRPAVIDEAVCCKCQHCFAVCPQGAISIFELLPEASLRLEGQCVDPNTLELLMKGRRTVRQYRQTNVDPALIRRLLEVAWHAPTGLNTQPVRFTVVDDREKMAAFRTDVLAGLSRLIAEGKLSESDMFGSYPRQWKEHGNDVLFRGAPHMVVASAPADGVSPVPDCFIALSYLELFAASLGLGTVWSGLAKHAIDGLVPEMRTWLGIPENHVIGFVLTFGYPAVHYARTVQRGPANVKVVG